MSKIQGIGIKDDNLPFRIVNKALLDQELQRLPKGRYVYTIEKASKKKSLPQLGYLFGVIYPLVLRHLIDAGWEFTSVEEVDMLCKEKFAGKEIINRDSGEIITIPALKREMTTIEFNSYINAIRQWDAEYLGGYIPEPNEQIEIEYK